MYTRFEEDMNVFLLIKLVFSATVAADMIEVLFPVSDMISWTNLVPETINCAKNAHPTKPVNSTKILGHVPLLHTNYDMSGFLCTGIILHTR